MVRNVKLTTTASNQNIFTLAVVKNSIIERMGWKNLPSATQLSNYNALFENGIKIKFTLLFPSDNTVSINGGIPNALIEEIAYDSGGYTPYTKSIAIGSAAQNIIFSYDIQ